MSFFYLVFSVFRKWDQKSKNLVLLNCKILSYDPEKVVLGNLAWDPPEFIYFLISGQCKIVKVSKNKN